jgi:hypothetical protein
MSIISLRPHLKKKHGSAHVNQHGLQGIVTVSYKTHRNSYQISRYVSLWKKCIVTPLDAMLSALWCQKGSCDLRCMYLCGKPGDYTRSHTGIKDTNFSHNCTLWQAYLIDWLAFNANFISISAISWSQSINQICLS